MALIKCRECKTEVSDKAAACPHCGAPIKAKEAETYKLGCGGILLLLVIVGIFGGMIRSCERDKEQEIQARAESDRRTKLTPEQRAAEDKAKAVTEADKKRRDEAVSRAVAAAGVLKRSMRDPESFAVTWAIVVEETGAGCYEYRAKNGFGGFNQGRAVMAPGGKAMLTSEMKGFTKLWNAECANKSGQSIAAAIKMFGN